MAPIVEIMSEVGSAFVGTPSGSNSETLTTATSSEDGSCKGPEIEGPEIALEDAAAVPGRGRNHALQEQRQ
jgi:hypothetical protein